MSAAKHTPGPWEYVAKLSASENHKGFFVRAEKPTRNGKWALAEVQPGDEDGHLGEANAILIAASPKLLASLRELHRVCVGMDHPDQMQRPEEAEYLAAVAGAAAALQLVDGQ